jgi:catechol 2,3-dioxygenase-like lactoylglutathione lyase family enzyme
VGLAGILPATVFADPTGKMPVGPTGWKPVLRCGCATLPNSVTLSQSLMELEGIDHVALAVRDVEQAANWYMDVLGFERRYAEMWDGIPTFIAKGNTAVALFPLRNNDSRSATRTGRIGMLHLAFRADRRNFLSAQEELKRRGIKFEFQDHEISHSIYFRDPDGHELEITTYEL